jgi:Flp pilus assembly protein TadD
MAASARNQYQETMKRGWDAQQAGDFTTAEALFKEVLRVRSRTPEAMHLLGALYSKMRRRVDPQGHRHSTLQRRRPRRPRRRAPWHPRP